MTDGPITVSIVVQADLAHLPGCPDQTFAGDLAVLAEDLVGYVADNLRRFTEPRGGDLFVILVCSRGDEKAGHQYRDGRFLNVSTGTPDGP